VGQLAAVGAPVSARLAGLGRGARVALLAAGWLLLSGHVGSNNVVLEGMAGGYPVRVVITPPGVVPAQVPIVVRVLNGTPTRVTVQAAQWNIGTKGAPPPEEASVVAGEPGVWAHDLWIMTSSTYAVHVAVEGPAGNGELVVPMQSSATQTLGMNRIMSVVLVVLGTLLVVGVLTIVGAATREGSLPAGAKPTPAHRRKARIAMAFTAALVGLELLGGAKWWAAEEAAYRRSLFRPVESASTVRAVDDARVLTVAITDSLWHAGRYSPMMPDHGKMMHLFLVRADDAGAIGHLHPVRVHADSFTTRVPDLPAGRYLLFADILLQSGAQRTLVDTVEVPVAPVVAGSGARQTALSAVPGVPSIDTDDSWRVVPAAAIGEASSLAGGGTLVLRADTTIAVKRDLRLVATVRNADGRAAMLEPYMGMGGHAMVMRVDGGVFMHLHPMGTASMAAQAQLIRRERGDTVRRDSATLVAESTVLPTPGMRAAATAHDMHMGSAVADVDSTGTLAFPFAFPGAGEYRVFVQVKRAGAVETAAFRVVVPPDEKVARP
jgi:hypothetical protein